MTGEQKQAASPYRCNEDDLGCLNDYFMAALQGEESKAALLHPAGMLDEERWGMISVGRHEDVFFINAEERVDNGEVPP